MAQSSLVGICYDMIRPLIAYRLSMRLLLINGLMVATLASVIVGGNPAMLNTSNHTQMIHVVLSILSFSVLIVASLQSLLLAVAEHRIRENPQSLLLRPFPPLESLETGLFRLISLGFILLTVLLLSSILFYHAVLLQQFLGKTLITVAAWSVFAVLLMGRAILGWRGKKAIYCTIFGVGLLLAAFIFGKLITLLIS